MQVQKPTLWGGGAMKAYLVTTATLFGLIAVLHGWRVFEERSSLARDPWVLIITLVAALLCGWAVSLLRRRPATAEKFDGRLRSFRARAVGRPHRDDSHDRRRLPLSGRNVPEPFDPRLLVLREFPERLGYDGRAQRRSESAGRNAVYYRAALARRRPGRLAGRLRSPSFGGCRKPVICASRGSRR